MNPSSKFRNSKWWINMVAENAKRRVIAMKFSNRRFFGSLITNLSLKFRNLKWRIQYGGPKSKNLLGWYEILYLSVFGVAGQIAKILNGAFNMVDSNSENDANIMIVYV